MTLVVGNVGCGRTIQDRELSQLLPKGTTGGGIERPDEHDFGVVLADGQLLRHSFTFKNNLNKQMNIKNVLASTPCCSDIESVALTSLPPGAETLISVTFRVGVKTERRRVQFLVETDDKLQPFRTLTLSAYCYPAWEIQKPEPIIENLVVNRGKRIVVKMIGRSLKGGSDVLPDEIVAEDPLKASFSSKPSKTDEDKSLVSFERLVSIDIPPSSTRGGCQSRITYQWKDGRKQFQDIYWEVLDPIRVKPKTIARRGAGYRASSLLTG